MTFEEWLESPAACGDGIRVKDLLDDHELSAARYAWNAACKAMQVEDNWASSRDYDEQREAERFSRD